jgi:hypothetical protein
LATRAAACRASCPTTVSHPASVPCQHPERQAGADAEPERGLALEVAGPALCRPPCLALLRQQFPGFGRSAGPSGGRVDVELRHADQNVVEAKPPVPPEGHHVLELHFDRQALRAVEFKRLT